MTDSGPLPTIAKMIKIASTHGLLCHTAQVLIARTTSKWVSRMINNDARYTHALNIG